EVHPRLQAFEVGLDVGDLTLNSQRVLDLLRPRVQRPQRVYRVLQRADAGVGVGELLREVLARGDLGAHVRRDLADTDEHAFESLGGNAYVHLAAVHLGVLRAHDPAAVARGDLAYLGDGGGHTHGLDGHVNVADDDPLGRYLRHLPV